MRSLHIAAWEFAAPPSARGDAPAIAPQGLASQPPTEKEA